jgi:hypothetical protein
MRESARLVYVGEAKRGFYRCLQGFQVSNQPIAYPWRPDNDLKNAIVECLIFGGFVPYGALKLKSVRQAVEADVAAEIYAVAGLWPTKLSRLDVYGKFDRAGALTRYSAMVIRELRSRNWL